MQPKRCGNGRTLTEILLDIGTSQDCIFALAGRRCHFYFVLELLKYIRKQICIEGEVGGNFLLTLSVTREEFFAHIV